MLTRLAQLVTRYPKLVVAIWVVVGLFAAPLAELAPARLVANASAVRNSEAQQVADIYTAQFKQPVIDRTLIVSEANFGASDPRFVGVYGPLKERLAKIPGVLRVVPYDAQSPLKQRSDDGKVTVTVLETRLKGAEEILEAIRGQTHKAQGDGIKFYVTGAGAVTKDFLHLLEADINRSERTAIPLTAIVLLLAFGALVATGLPLLVGIIAITGSMAGLFFLTGWGEVSSFAQSVITMLSLGAGIDYALIFVSRFREELAKGLNPQKAAEITTRTAGRAVTFSGLVVAIAMGAMLVPDLTFIRSMGIGGVMAVGLTVLTAITLLPALLCLLGERVNSPRRLAFKLTSSGRVHPFWGHWAERVMERPLVSALLVAGLLLALAWPATRMKLGYPGAFGLGPQVESRKGLELLQGLELGGVMDSFEVLLDLGEGGFTAQSRAKWRNLEQSISAWPEVRLVISPFLAGRLQGDGGFADLINLNNQYLSQDRRYLRLSVVPKDPVLAPNIPDWYKRLKAQAQSAGFERVLLGGAPVGSMEFTNAMLGAIPKAVATVFIATFLLLAMAFRSLLIPLKSIAMNTLTVGAAYGVITLVFQEGYLAQLIGVSADAGGVDSSLPLMMFAVIFGLSMDYEIFLLSRVQEGHVKGLDTRVAVKQAIQHTAGIITSAALIMIIVFAAFIAGEVIANKTVGLGLAVAVFLDATLVRLILVPAVMVLAGKWNWWLPASLKRVMPRVSLES